MYDLSFLQQTVTHSLPAPPSPLSTLVFQSLIQQSQIYVKIGEENLLNGERS
jgi:hypothetical protein